MDMVIEMNWEGIELNKLKICLEGKAKQVYLSFGDSIKIVILLFRISLMHYMVTLMKGVLLLLSYFIQLAEQDLNYFVSDITLLANKAFPTDKDSAQVQAKEALPKGCIHQSEADFVFKMCHFRAFSPSLPDHFSGNKASVGNFAEGELYDSQSPDGGRIIFQVGKVKTFCLTGAATTLPVSPGPRISHRIRGAGISHPEVVKIYRSYFPSSWSQECGRNLLSEYSSCWNFSPDAKRDNQLSDNRYQTSAERDRVDFVQDSHQSKSQGFYSYWDRSPSRLCGEYS